MLRAERLRDRMRDCALTQAELARRVGVKQQTIGRMVAGDVYGSRHLHRIARELDTTPAYLTGETDDPDSHLPDDALDAEERDWLEVLRSLDKPNREAVLVLTRALANSTAARTLHEPRREYRTGTDG